MSILRYNQSPEKVYAESDHPYSVPEFEQVTNEMLSRLTAECLKCLYNNKMD